MLLASLTFAHNVLMTVCSYAHPFILADNRHYTFYLWKNVFARNEMNRYLLVPLYLFGFWSARNVFGESVLSLFYLNTMRNMIIGCTYPSCTYYCLRNTLTNVQGGPCCVGRNRSLLWQLVFWVCTAAALVPSPLLEFRYFIVPFHVLQLHDRGAQLGKPEPDQPQQQQRTEQQHVQRAIGESANQRLHLLTCAINVMANAVLIAAVGYMFFFRTFRWPDGSLARFMW